MSNFVDSDAKIRLFNNIQRLQEQGIRIDGLGGSSLFEWMDFHGKNENVQKVRSVHQDNNNSIRTNNVSSQKASISKEKFESDTSNEICHQGEINKSMLNAEIEKNDKLKEFLEYAAKQGIQITKLKTHAVTPPEESPPLKPTLDVISTPIQPIATPTLISQPNNSLSESEIIEDTEVQVLTSIKEPKLQKRRWNKRSPHPVKMPVSEIKRDKWAKQQIKKINKRIRKKMKRLKKIPKQEREFRELMRAKPQVIETPKKPQNHEIWQKQLPFMPQNLSQLSEVKLSGFIMSADDFESLLTQCRQITSLQLSFFEAACFIESHRPYQTNCCRFCIRKFALCLTNLPSLTQLTVLNPASKEEEKKNWNWSVFVDVLISLIEACQLPKLRKLVISYSRDCQTPYHCFNALARRDLSEQYQIVVQKECAEEKELKSEPQLINDQLENRLPRNVDVYVKNVVTILE